MTKLSIIIPVYNIEKYISNCLNSILNQSFKDFEVICVNDGSTDNSLAELQKCKDERLIIIDKKNEGSGVARNSGLAIARGEYIFFVDGDDWIEENSLQKMVDEADRLKTDILIFGGQSYYPRPLKLAKPDSMLNSIQKIFPRPLREREEFVNKRSEFTNSGEGYKKQNGGYSANKLPQKYLNKVFSAEDIKKDIFKFPSTAWTKLYRREFLQKNNIKFQEIKVGQDQLPFFHSMIMADRIALLPENLYCYRKNRKGAVTAVKKKKNFSPIYVFYGVEEVLQKTGKLDDYKDIFVKRYFSKATSWLAKFQDDLKEEYFTEYSKLLKHVQVEYGLYKHFKPNIKDGYWKLKFKQILAK